MSMKEDIQKLKQEKNAIVLAHYYVEGDVQDAADFVGDSFALAKKAKEIRCTNHRFCQVFVLWERVPMILNPDKKGIDAGYECRIVLWRIWLLCPIFVRCEKKLMILRSSVTSIQRQN